MIVTAILNLVAGLLGLLLSPLHIPALPEGVSSVMSTGMSYVRDGLTLIAAYTHWGFLCALFFAAVAIEAAMLVYKFVMWIIKKIPVSME